MKTHQFLLWASLGASLLVGCTSMTPPAPAIVPVATNAVLKPRVFTNPAPILLPVLVINRSSALPSDLTTNYDGTNIIICGIGTKTHKPFCVTNPPPPPLPLTNFTIAWSETNFTSGHQWLPDEIIYSTNGVVGPWNTLLFIAPTNTNMQVTLPINPRLRNAFFRVRTLSP